MGKLSSGTTTFRIIQERHATTNICRTEGSKIFRSRISKRCTNDSKRRYAILAKTGNPPDGGRTLFVRFQHGDEDGLQDTFRALDRGETPEPHFEVVFEDPADIHRVTRPRNLELLRTIVQHEPDSIRETARLVDRDVRQVHDNLAELEALHLLEFEEDGRRKRPTVWYDSIELDLSLTSSGTTRDEANA